MATAGEGVVNLSRKVDRLAKAVEDERDAKREANNRQAQSNKRMKVVIALFAFVAVLGVGTAGWAVHLNQELRTQRTEARKNTCEKDKKFADAHNALVDRDKGLVIAIATNAGRRPVAPENEAALDEQLVAYDQQKVEVPDCTAAGIAAFYKGEKK